MPRAMFFAVSAFAALLTIFGCSKTEVITVYGPFVTEEGLLGPEPGELPDPDGGASVNLTVSGRAGYYRHVPLPSGLSGYRVYEVCQFVTVQAVGWAPPHAVLGEDTSDELGRYSIDISTSADFYIRVLADMDYGTRITVSASTLFPLIEPVAKTRTSLAPPEPILYAASSKILHRADGDQQADVIADTKLPYARGGAFSILGTFYKCLRTMEAAGVLNSLPDKLNVVWSPGNLGQYFSLSTSSEDFFAAVPGTAFIFMGEGEDHYLTVSGGDPYDVQNSDHDEYDEAVLAHEFGHFIMFTTSRDQNWGGPHSGESIVPAAAYSEGLPSAIGCALLGNSAYIDTRGLPPTSELLFAFDCEDPPMVPGVEGYDAEFSVIAVGWDILDGLNGLTDFDNDGVEIDFTSFFNSLSNLATRDEPYDIAWLASLLQQLIDDGALTIAQANDLMASEGAAFPPMASDLWPEDLLLPDAVTGGLDASTGPGGTPPNAELGANANAVFRFDLATSEDVTFELEATPFVYFAANHRIDLYIYDLNHHLVFYMIGIEQEKSATVALADGVYMVRVHHAAPNPQPVTFSLRTQ
ncbi:MAG: hypothetical protein IT462_08980 [Planctomycetes bacterium]|nr:hypothetical protein [Planctomycetota bacterium]